MANLSLLVILALLASAPVTGGPTPKTTKKATKAIPTLKLAPRAAPRPDAPADANAAPVVKMKKKVDLVVGNARKLSVSAQRPIDGAAFLMTRNASAITMEVAGLRPRGVHVEKDGYFAIVVPRSWVGAHDLIVECTGALPESVSGFATLLLDNGAWIDYGNVTLFSYDGRAKFLLTTSGLTADSIEWLAIKVTDAANAGAPWRVDSCSVEYE